MMNMIKKEKGFTLIELMIVVAIIGILASIAIPQFASYRIKAFNAAAQADLHSIQSAAEVFFNDNSYYPFTTAVSTGTISLAGGTGSVDITQNLSSGVSAAIGSAASGTPQTYAASTKHSAGDLFYTTSSATPTISSSSASTGAALAAVPTAP